MGNPYESLAQGGLRTRCNTARCGLSGDTDGDGILDPYDLDDDNDGLDVDEGDGATDTDSDGTPDSLTSDSDDDGCDDVTEAGFTDAMEMVSSMVRDLTRWNGDGSDGYGTPIVVPMVRPTSKMLLLMSAMPMAMESPTTLTTTMTFPIP